MTIKQVSWGGLFWTTDNIELQIIYYNFYSALSLYIDNSLKYGIRFVLFQNSLIIAGNTRLKTLSAL